MQAPSGAIADGVPMRETGSSQTDSLLSFRPPVHIVVPLADSHDMDGLVAGVMDQVVLANRDAPVAIDNVLCLSLRGEPCQSAPT